MKLIKVKYPAKLSSVLELISKTKGRYWRKKMRVKLKVQEKVRMKEVIK